MSAFIFYGCENKTETETNYKVLPETNISEIHISTPYNSGNFEYSGLSWYKNYLVMLPQYPFGMGSTSNDGSLFVLKKSMLDEYLANPENHAPLTPDSLKIFAEGLTEYNHRGSGYESVGFIEDNAYFTIEAIDSPTKTYLVKGLIDSVNMQITLDASTLTQIPLQTDINNIGYETIAINGDKIIVVNEANGLNLLSNPKVFVYDKNLNLLDTLSIPHVEYRITDATYVNNDKFYAINYFYTGDRTSLNPAEDSVAIKFGISNSQSSYSGIERILSFKIEENKIIFSGENPIYWHVEKNNGKNWEGIAQYGDKGFFIITDTFPTTILSFVSAR